MFDESAARKVDALTLGSCPMAGAGLGLFRGHSMTHGYTWYNINRDMGPIKHPLPQMMGTYHTYPVVVEQVGYFNNR